MVIPSLRKILFLFMLSGKIVNVADNPTYKVMPSSDDLRYFVNAIDNVVSYVERNTTVLRLPNFMFGFFLSNVNLKLITRNQENFVHVPLDVNELLDLISQRIDALMYIYNTTSIKFLSQKTRTVNHLFENTTRWCNQLPSFHLPHKTLAALHESPSQLTQMYRDYKTYSADVKAIEKWEPTSEISDECFVALSSYEYKARNTKVKFCELPVSCENILKTGTDVGYALSHRIIFLAAARLGVGCFLLGKLQDDVLKEKLCQDAYDEGRYIAMNGYEFISLMMEYVAVCSMLGHTEFLRRDWLEESIRHQTKAGCFNNPSNAIDKDVSQETESPCDIHLTGVSVAAITSAVRWILENDYVSNNSLYDDKKMPLLPFLRRVYLINSDHDESNNLLNIGPWPEEVHGP